MSELIKGSFRALSHFIFTFQYHGIVKFYYSLLLPTIRLVCHVPVAFNCLFGLFLMSLLYGCLFGGRGYFCWVPFDKPDLISQFY